jgi:hypothetical protein
MARESLLAKNAKFYWIFNTESKKMSRHLSDDITFSFDHNLEPLCIEYTNKGFEDGVKRQVVLIQETTCGSDVSINRPKCFDLLSEKKLN